MRKRHSPSSKSLPCKWFLLPCKWPLLLTLIVFSQPGFYLYFRIGKPEIFNLTEFLTKIVGAVLISIIVWISYGIYYLVTNRQRTVVIEGQRVPKSCSNCEFSEKTSQTSMDSTQNIEYLKCHLTGYSYDKKYTCSKWKPKQYYTGENISPKDKDSNIVRPSSSVDRVTNDTHKTTHTSIASYVGNELDKAVHQKYQPNKTKSIDNPIERCRDIPESKSERKSVAEKLQSIEQSEPVRLGRLENCGNCDVIIGKLENSYIFEGNIVCVHCYKKMETQK